MKIRFEEIPWAFSDSQKAIPKSAGKYFCSSCRKTLDERQFFKSLRADRHPEGYLPHCKTCTTMAIDDSDPSTFLPLLKEADAPYLPIEWRKLLAKKAPKAGSILGKYLSLVKLNQHKKYRWADSEALYEESTKSLLEALRQESDTETEAEKKVEEMMSFSDMNLPPSPTSSASFTEKVNALYGLVPENSKYGLTQEEINKLKVDWGADYTEDEYLALEQQFNDMREAYVIQDPIAISNTKMICKMTVKMNKFLDIDDVESASKLSRQLDLFIKSANLAPVQQKDRQQTTFAISQLAFLIEREGGFVPQWDEYSGEALDKLDMILADMKEYTNYLVRGETNIAEMVENTETILAQDALPKAQLESYDQFAALEQEILAGLSDGEEGEE